MFCEKCGTNNVSSAKFCAGCGANLQQQTANSYDDGFNQPTAPANYDDNGSRLRQNSENGYQQAYGQNQYGYNQTGQQNQYGYNQGYQQNQYSYDYGYRQGYAQPRVGGNGLNIVSVIVSVLAGLLALTCIGMAFIPSISFNSKTTVAAGSNASNSITYLNSDMRKQMESDATDAANSGDEYSYNQNFVEFAIQNFNSLYHSEEYKKVKEQAEKWKVDSEETSKLATEATDYTIRAAIALAMFIIPMIFLLVGAIMSFVRKPGAAGMLMTGGIIFLVAAIYWVLFINNAAPLGRVFFVGAYSNSGIYHANTGKLMTAAPVLMIVFSALTIAAAVGEIIINKAKERR